LLGTSQIYYSSYLCKEIEQDNNLKFTKYTKLNNILLKVVKLGLSGIEIIKS
jgi:hypothetical protein